MPQLHGTPERGIPFARLVTHGDVGTVGCAPKQRNDRSFDGLGDLRRRLAPRQPDISDARDSGIARKSVHNAFRRLVPIMLFTLQTLPTVACQVRSRRTVCHRITCQTIAGKIHPSNRKYSCRLWRTKSAKNAARRCLKCSSRGWLVKCPPYALHCIQSPTSSFMQYCFYT